MQLMPQNACLLFCATYLRRMAVWECALMVLASVAMAGCSRLGNRRKAQEIARGQILFETHCGGCHNGKKVIAGIEPPSLNGIFQRGFLPSGLRATNAHVRSTILEGRSGIMPSFQNILSNRDINDIIEYLHTLKPNAAS
jgi:mono/diheme cytochrome c family protein